jgi:hypothetical protein
LLSAAALHKVAKYKETLETPLQSTKYVDLRKEIADRIGPLSKPSKMPGYAWGISAKHCITGSKLAKVPGTPCSICYALQGLYTFPNVIDAQARRLRGWKEDSDWKPLITMAIILTNNPYFRWFDSGDLQSQDMLHDIVWIAQQLPEVKFWLPTQERQFVKDVNLDIENLTVRISSSKLNITLVNHPYSSSVGDESPEHGVHVCPSKQQKNQCGNCRACWDKNVKHVKYIAH